MTQTVVEALPNDVDHLVGVVMKAACERNWLIATAESCTGGMIAALLTDVDGCGRAFDRGFVTYTDAAKERLLDVPRSILAGPGAVSEPCARAMVIGALRHSDADLAIAVTGFTGPAGPDDEAGLVYFAIARRGRAVRVVERHFGDVPRGVARRMSLRQAMVMLRDQVV